MACKLWKALYGVRQAPHALYSKINQHFLNMDFERSTSEPTLYKKLQGTSHILLLYIYVDDIIYMSYSSKMLLEFKSTMMKAFEMLDLDLVKYFLGLEVKHGEGFVFVS